MSAEDQTVTLVRNTKDIFEKQQLGEATTQIQYDSSGHALVIGTSAQALSWASDLKLNGLTVVEVDSAASGVNKQLTDEGIAVFTVPELSLTGYLGAFKAVVPTNDAAGSDFDLAVSVLSLIHI